MIVYLDQNKWIELARIINGVETSERATTLVQERKYEVLFFAFPIVKQTARLDPVFFPAEQGFLRSRVCLNLNQNC